MYVHTYAKNIYTRAFFKTDAVFSFFFNTRLATIQAIFAMMMISVESYVCSSKSNIDDSTYVRAI